MAAAEVVDLTEAVATTENDDAEIVEISSPQRTESRRSTRIRNQRRREIPSHWSTSTESRASTTNRRRRRQRNLEMIQSRRRQQISENSFLWRVWSQFVAGLAFIETADGGSSEINYEAALDLANRVGVVKPAGLSKLEMEHLVRRPHLGQEDACAICLETMRRGEPSVVLPCGHCFHDACAVEWLGVKAECPTCRGKVKPLIVIS